MPNCPYTPAEINEIELKSDLLACITDSKAEHSEWVEQVLTLVGPKAGNEAARMSIKMLRWANDPKVSKDELETLIRSLSPGYLRSELRCVWRDK